MLLTMSILHRPPPAGSAIGATHVPRRPKSVALDPANARAEMLSGASPVLVTNTGYTKLERMGTVPKLTTVRLTFAAAPAVAFSAKT